MLIVLFHLFIQDYISLEHINLKLYMLDYLKFGLNKPPPLEIDFIPLKVIAYSAVLIYLLHKKAPIKCGLLITR